VIALLTIPFLDNYVPFWKATFVRLKELLIRDFASLDAGLSMKEAAERLLQCHYRFFVVTTETGPLGVVDRNAILDAVAAGRYNEPVSRLVPQGPAATLNYLHKDS